MATALSNKAIKKMSEIVKATVEGSYVFTDESIWGNLVKNGYVITNPEIADVEGQLATQATELGIEQFGPKADESAVHDQLSVFVIEDVAVDPPKSRKRGVSGLYPFNELGVGQSFFVPATADKPEPWKTLASTVGSAIKRFAVEYDNEDGTSAMRAIKRGPKAGQMVKATKNTRVFAISKDTKNGVNGARIGRTS